jgi:hypothetical protein
MDPERRKIVVQCLLYAFFDYAHPERMEPPYNMIALMWQAYQHGKFHAVTMDEIDRVIWELLGPVVTAAHVPV